MLPFKLGKKIAELTVILLAFILIGACSSEKKLDYSIKSIKLTDVRFDDNFWSKRIETDIKVTIPHIFKEEETTGRIKNFENASPAGKGDFCSNYPFDDSDVYKTIEAASYALMLHYDPELDKYLDSLIAKIAAAQEKDGYLYTARTIKNKGGKVPLEEWLGNSRWQREEEAHELYDAGHLYEAAVAHYQATHKKTLLNVALKNADLVLKDFGPGKLMLPPGHQEIEIGLVKLYRLTGEKKYLDQAKFFLDQRGNARGHKLYGFYSQDHLPVTQQTEAVGHAVRAAYMYSAMADVAALTGDQAYVQALDKLWEDVVFRKIYLTGGIGSTGAWEGFGPAYNLPNASAYCETCASIANAFWNYRMFLLQGEGKYLDVFERIIFNGVLSGVSLSGDKFFYANPLASFGQQERSPWFGCACCPPNIARFLPQLGQYVYATSGNRLYVNLYGQSTSKVKMDNQELELEQETEYPWKGDIKIKISPEKAAEFSVYLRIPGWALGEAIPGGLYYFADKVETRPMVKVNGQEIPLKLENGFLPISRQWKAGDTIEINLPMEPHRVLANEKVKDDLGLVAVQRGPIVYCAEWPDNYGRVSNLLLPDGAAFTTEFKPELLGGVTLIKAPGQAFKVEKGKIISQAQEITLIPYYAWAHRGRGEMAVWIAREKDKVRPQPEPSLASKARVEASEGAKGTKFINDQYEPENSDDHSVGYLHWWPKKGTTEWVSYEFPKPVKVSEVAVYWFDDTGEGECRVPASWKLFYRQGNHWTEVKAKGSYGVEKDKYNIVKFSPVTTTGLKIELKFQKDFSAGLQEWEVK
ncbi:MAG TPA: glycoside hydrolase family 127 protein [Candidatus Aminicenantes bacterium]|nr:MAG: six-hairpin glycosidase [Candidatus Aminicenantes bacterium]HEK85547.1 glycoside hydrolase family 127 protein [Candidatus Aminicenantes bacterium]